MPDSYCFGVEPIKCHAWNSDRKKLAVAANNEVHLYGLQDDEWVLDEVLVKHDLAVTGIDWAPRTNRIVTCSADRNAYVWTPAANGQWTPELVLLRIDRAATCVRWSPSENKFAVGSGARLISVCYYEVENNWWVSKHIKKHFRSTVTCLDWHPSNCLLAAGSTDFNVRIFSAFIKGEDERSLATTWGSNTQSAQIVDEFPNSVTGGGGWVHWVAFSPSGDRLAWVGHDSTVSVATAGHRSAVAVIKTKVLPFLTCLWISEHAIVVAGHDYCPMLFTVDASGERIFYGGKVDDASHRSPKKSSMVSAMRKFKLLDRQATVEEDGNQDTLHQNAVNGLRLHGGGSDACRPISRFSTSAVDGQVIVWHVDDFSDRLKEFLIRQ